MQRAFRTAENLGKVRCRPGQLDRRERERPEYRLEFAKLRMRLKSYEVVYIEPVIRVQ